MYTAKEKVYRLTDIENKLVVTSREREVGRGRKGVWDEEIQTTMFKTDKQQRYLEWHKKL